MADPGLPIFQAALNDTVAIIAGAKHQQVDLQMLLGGMHHAIIEELIRMHGREAVADWLAKWCQTVRGAND